MSGNSTVILEAVLPLAYDALSNESVSQIYRDIMISVLVRIVSVMGNSPTGIGIYY